MIIHIKRNENNKKINLAIFEAGGKGEIPSAEVIDAVCSKRICLVSSPIKCYIEPNQKDLVLVRLFLWLHELLLRCTVI